MITPAHAFFNWAILRKWFRPWWVVAGSVLPDAPPFVAFFYLLAQKGFNQGNMGGFFGFVMANGNPNRQPGFMEMSFLLSSLPLYALVGVLVVYLRRKWLSSLWAGWGSTHTVRLPDPRRGRLRASLPVLPRVEAAGPGLLLGPAIRRGDLSGRPALGGGSHTDLDLKQVDIKPAEEFRLPGRRGARKRRLTTVVSGDTGR